MGKDSDTKEYSLSFKYVLYPNVYGLNDNNKLLNEESNWIYLEYWINDKDGKFKMNDNFILFGVGREIMLDKVLQ